MAGPPKHQGAVVNAHVQLRPATARCWCCATYGKNLTEAREDRGAGPTSPQGKVKEKGEKRESRYWKQFPKLYSLLSLLKESS